MFVIRVLIVSFGGILFSSALYTSAGDQSNIDKAVEVINSLCLSGSEYKVDADVQGNITFKSLKPSGSGSVTLNVREANGATAFQEDLRLIADENIRECTQKHLGKIVDALLASPDVHNSYMNLSSLPAYNSFANAKYLGYLPQQVSVKSFVEGENKIYYRLSITKPSMLRFEFFKLSNMVDASFYSMKRTKIDSGFYGNGSRSKEHFVMPGDYYIEISARNKKATAFQLTVVANEDV
ncbi:hypothetical protein [Teredinibacter sp. KSP-S5-2]|uniref:hypothetical protein n=1 Tax=Teredinibacter sp. KSP-S5-2 TaxID=3034506 RepID=UPI0029351CAA|nr:hypothetical protein [Teredinibacter sp. KSP-S5-2]WNO10082.1 hypothetical protein P5V12_02740 [Teredinibacter sp. KSP-S5-2]